MRHFIYLAIVSLPLAALGCRPSRQPVSVPAASPGDESNASASKPSEPAPTTVAQTDSGSKAVPAPESPKAAANQPPTVRDVVGKLLEADGEGGWRVNERAATELEKLGADADKELLPLLEDAKVEVRRGAAFHLLGRFNPNDAQHVAAFTKLLRDPDRTVRGIGLSAVNQMHPNDQVAAVPQLATLLDPKSEDKPENRAAIARLFGSLKSEAAAAANQLARVAVEDPDARVRSASLVALSQVAEPSSNLPVFTKALKDTDPAVRQVAVARLRQMGNAATGSADELAGALGDTNPRVRDAAAEVLIRLGGPAVGPLAEVTASGNLDSRKLALACLARIGPRASSAMPAIEKALMDPDPQIRMLAEAAIARIKGL